MNVVGERAQALITGIQETAQLLRDEHFPYEEGVSVYEALHEVLRAMQRQGETILYFAEKFPDEVIGSGQAHHLTMLELTLKTIKEKLG